MSSEDGRPRTQGPGRAAVALAYQDGDGAPRVVAQGRGDIADEIVRRARAAGVFTYESRELVSLLMQVDLDAHIPPALYVAIAELLVWIWRVEQGSARVEEASAATA